MIAGAMTMGVMGIATYTLRSIPRFLYDFILKHTTTTLVTTSQNIVFHNLLKWLHDEGYADKFRKVKLSNGRYGYNNRDFTKSVGYGSHIIWYKCCPILIQLNKEESKSEYDKEMITLKKFGRSHKIFDDLINQIAKKDDHENMTEMYNYNKSWQFVTRQPYRAMNSVIIPKEVKDKLLNTIDVFLDREDWYIENGIPYQLGILLSGPPGSGKTSVIKALAAYCERTISMLEVGGFSFIDSLRSVPDNTITVVEDVDAALCTRSRNKAKEKMANDEVSKGEVVETVTDPKAPSGGDESVEDARMQRYVALYGDRGLSELLNAVDGVMSAHGRILVMTTNHPERLDKALLRPGRVDLNVEIGYITPELFIEFVCRFFPDIDLRLFENRDLKSNVLTGAELQGDILEGMSAEEIIESRTKESGVKVMSYTIKKDKIPKRQREVYPI